jgi:hypothetical protein
MSTTGEVPYLRWKKDVDQHKIAYSPSVMSARSAPAGTPP